MRVPVTQPRPLALEIASRAGKLAVSADERARLVRLTLERIDALLLHLAALCWVIAVFAAIIWTQHGLNPRYFSAPDEAVNRHAAQLVADHGRPFDTLPQTDPGDLLHERLWLSVGDHAIPAYPPAAYYIQGALLKIPAAGFVLIAALPALAVGAFVLGVGGFAKSRRVLAAAAPLLAFPALYYMMRPWMNMSLFLSFFCFAVCFWSTWLRSRSGKALFGATIATSLAAAVRPDYAPFVMCLALVACMAEARQGERKKLIAAVIAAGVGAVAINLVLNAVTTGKPFTTAYAIWDERHAVTRPWSSLPGPLSALMYIVMPYGWPSGSEIVDQVGRYWIRLGPIGVVLLAQCALVPLLIRAGKRRALGYAAVAMIGVLFVLTHVSPDIYGAGDDVGLLRHSVTRYWTPVYLLAAIAPLALIMRAKREWVGIGLLVVVAALGSRTILRGQPETIESMRSLYEQRSAEVAQWQTIVPPDAVVFSVNLDKLVWSRWDTATISTDPDQAPTADAAARLIAGGHPVYVTQIGLPDRLRTQLAGAMTERGLVLEALPADPALYRVRLVSAVSSPQSP